MATRVGKHDWRRLVKSSYPRELRSTKATMLLLAELMSADGTLAAWRGQMADAAGLPLRSLDRHIARAVRGAWLRHEMHGGKRRRAVYSATIPEQFCAPQMADRTSVLRATQYAQNPQFCAPPSGELNKDTHERSEYVALDRTRGRRDDHGEIRVTAKDERQERADEGVTRDPSAAVASPDGRQEHAPIPAQSATAGDYRPRARAPRTFSRFGGGS